MKKHHISGNAPLGAELLVCLFPKKGPAGSGRERGAKSAQPLPFDLVTG